MAGLPCRKEILCLNKALASIYSIEEILLDFKDVDTFEFTTKASGIVIGGIKDVESKLMKLVMESGE